MAALISSVITTETLGREGMLATTDPLTSTIVRRSDDTELFFGRAVIRDGADNLVVHPSGTAGTFVGLVVEELSIPAALLTANDIPIGHDATIMTAGIMWVIPEQNVTQGDPVYYRHTTPGASPEFLGRLRMDADTADATLIAGAQWFSTATAGNPAMVRLNAN